MPCSRRCLQQSSFPKKKDPYRLQRSKHCVLPNYVWRQVFGIGIATHHWPHYLTLRNRKLDSLQHDGCFQRRPSQISSEMGHRALPELRQSAEEPKYPQERSGTSPRYARSNALPQVHTIGAPCPASESFGSRHPCVSSSLSSQSFPSCTNLMPLQQLPALLL
jgi:hypothetical protein